MLCSEENGLQPYGYFRSFVANPQSEGSARRHLSMRRSALSAEMSFSPPETYLCRTLETND